MTRKAVDIKLKENYVLPTPFAKPRPTQLHWKKAEEEILEQLLSIGAIKKFAPGTTSPTCAHGFCVSKPKSPGEPRYVVDYSKLNREIIRPTYPTPSPEQVWQKIPPEAKYFVSLDLTSSYWQLRLSEESQLLTSFMTPLGRYYFTVYPMGLSISSDVFQHELSEMIKSNPELTNVVLEIDDVLIFGDSFEKMLQQLRLFLKLCRKRNITLSPKKAQYADEDELLDFAG